ncbi:hypothetical protein O6P43_002178 [Quillaja saponaria]|uniref:Uncharacterized protein n=1 Tax=Quillaja saponaria TaxID=32244 RepID=A0AAD7VKB7_QUISA|nr:hypothetical protein O6P43_002178 [Quillaja saponaria]
MAASPMNPKSHCHARSNSLPSRPHPLILQCNEHLRRLGSDATSSSSSPIRHKLSGLQDLHDCVEKLLQLPLTQQSIVQESQEKWVDKLLDGSLRLLDVCTAAKDSLLHTKECARELQSIIRRRRGGELELATEVRKYLVSRKVARNAIHKSLGNLKAIEKKCTFATANKDHENAELISMLREVEAVTLSIFESLLSFISGPRQTKSKLSSWSLVSKLMQTKRVACTQETDENEFAKVDAAVQSFALQMTIKSDNINSLQNLLEKLESHSQGLEEELESLFRRLIKIRVSVLNILNN